MRTIFKLLFGLFLLINSYELVASNAQEKIYLYVGKSQSGASITYEQVPFSVTKWTSGPNQDLIIGKQRRKLDSAGFITYQLDPKEAQNLFETLAFQYGKQNDLD